MKHDLTDGVAGISNRKPFKQFAAPRFGLLPCQQSLAYYLELDDAECPFDAQGCSTLYTESVKQQ